MYGPSDERLDVALVGAGLASTLIALALEARRPGRKVAIFEQGHCAGGNHLWSFHAADVPPSSAAWVEPLVVRRWEAHEVRFDGFERRIDAAYASVSSERLAAVVEAWAQRPGARLERGAKVTRAEAHALALEDGRTFAADLVVDARGPGALGVEGRSAFQKFVGLELDLARDAPRSTPLLMDAHVPQTDGFRFFYVLPFGPRRVLVEDTYFSDEPALDEAGIEREVLAYAAREGYAVASIARRESGVLPLPLRAPAPRLDGGALAAGYAGGFFHPTTGYSFPAAVRVAECIAASEPADAATSPALAALVARHTRQARFAAFLNRLLYGAFVPEDRWNVLARFYRLPEPTIARFYALETTASDRARILCGRPPRGLDVARAVGSGGVA